MKPKQITDISYGTPSYKKRPPLNVLKRRRGSEPVAILSSVLDMQQTVIFYLFIFYIALKALSDISSLFMQYL